MEQMTPGAPPPPSLSAPPTSGTDARSLLAALSRVSAAINGSLSIRDVLPTVVDMVIEVTRAERGFIMLEHPLTGELEILAARNISREDAGAVTFDGSRTIIERARTSGQPVFTVDAASDERFQDSRSVASLGLRSVVCIPMALRGRRIGVIYVDNRVEADAFRQEDLDLLTAIANQAAVAIENARLQDVLEQSYVDTVNSLANALMVRDKYTRSHSETVAQLCVHLAKEMGLPQEMERDLYMVGMLHDVGKIGVRDNILLKPGALTEEERELMEQHAHYSDHIVDPLGLPEPVKLGIRHHQERYDGQGYPSGLAGQAIPLHARIVAVADSFHAMISDRVYRKALTLDKAVAELQRCAGTHFDPVIVEALLQVLSKVGLPDLLGESPAPPAGSA